MRTQISARDENKFFSSYAIEFLKAHFGKNESEENKKDDFNTHLKNFSCDHFESSQGKRYPSKALIISSDNAEQSILTLMFYTKGVNVEHAHSKEDLFTQFSKKQRFGIVIISDQFKSIGINFLTMYFRSLKNPPFLIYLGKDLGMQHFSMGFDAHLNYPFFTKDLFSILPKFETLI